MAYSITILYNKGLLDTFYIEIFNNSTNGIM